MSDDPSAAPDGPPPPPPHWAPPPQPPPPAYGQPAGGQPPYGQPQYGQPQYGQPPGGQQAQYGQPVYVRVSRPTNGLAVASMVLGILWLYWLGSVLAVIFGHIALHQFKQNPNQSGRGMALAGVILGWSGIGLFLVFLLALAARP